MAVRPTITFDAAGSDTQASGSLPATAIFGTAGATAASTVITLLVDNPDLSTVLTTGASALWINTAAGLQWARITAVDNTVGVKTVTVANALTGTESGLTWAIGGLRLDINATSSRKLIEADIKAGWAIVFNSAPTISSTLTPTTAGDTTDGVITVKATGVSTRLIFTQTANVPHFTMSSAVPTLWRFENLSFANSNATKTNANAFAWSNGPGGGSVMTWVNCGMDATNKCLRWHNRTSTCVPAFAHVGCDIANCTGTEAMSLVSSSQFNTFIGCAVHDNAGHGVILDSGYGCVILDNLGYANAGNAFRFQAAGSWLAGGIKILEGNTFDSATGANSGVDWSNAGSAFPQGLVWMNNSVTNNGSSGTAYGVNATALTDLVIVYNGYNNYNGNRTAATNNLTTGGATTQLGLSDLAVAPAYTGTPNFAPGAAMQGKGYPDSTYTVARVAGGTTTVVDIGGAQAASSAGGLRMPNRLQGAP